MIRTHVKIEVVFAGMGLSDFGYAVQDDFLTMVGNITSNPRTVELDRIYEITSRRVDEAESTRRHARRQATGVAVALRVVCLDERETLRVAVLLDTFFTNPTFQDFMARRQITAKPGYTYPPKAVSLIGSPIGVNGDKTGGSIGTVSVWSVSLNSHDDPRHIS